MFAGRYERCGDDVDVRYTTPKFGYFGNEWLCPACRTYWLKLQEVHLSKRPKVKVAVKQAAQPRGRS